MINKNNKKCALLVIDDDKDFCEEIEDLFSDGEVTVFYATNGSQANDVLAKERIDVVLLDLKLPDIDGIKLIPVIKNSNKDAIIIIITGHGSLDSATRAIKENVYDYITKPFDPSLLEIVVKEAYKKQELKKELEEKIKNLEKFKKLTVNRELEMIKLKERIRKLEKK